MATAWTGRLLVAWGGQTAARSGEAAANGAAYDPAANRWQVLPPSPLTARYGTTAVWTGREVLFWGGQAADGVFADGAAYEPEARTWRRLPAAPMGARADHQAVWTGREMVVWGGYAGCCPYDSVIHDAAAAAYDPATDQWRTIAPVPPLWSGDDGSAVTVVDGDRPLVWRRGHLGAYDAAVDQWEEIPGALAPPEPAPGELVTNTTGDPFALGVAAGGEAFLWTGPTGRLDGVAYRPAPPPGSWRRTARLTAQPGGTIAAGGPDRIYAAVGQSTQVLGYRIGEDRWEELPPAPIPTRSFAALVWTGSELLFWGGVGAEGPEMGGATWHCC